MAEFNTFSLAEAAQGAAALQNVRNNALAMAVARDKQARLSPLMAAAAGGDEAAQRQVVGIDPELGNQILTATSKMNDEQRTQFKNKIDITTRDLQAVMNAPDVYKDQAWGMVRKEMESTLGPDAVKDMPDRFDANWAQVNIDKGLSASDLINSRGTAFQPTPAYDKDGNLVFMQGSNVPGNAPAVIKDFKPVDKVDTAIKIKEGEARIDTEQAAAEVTATGAAKRGQTLIDEGRDAAKGIPVLRRTIGLLDSVKTGGFDNAALKAKQLFGVEGADEGELSANLGQAVLGDLKQTFGAQFTEKEGERLAKMRAGFGKSVETNKRLMGQALQIAEQAAQRAIDRAVEQKDYGTAKEIQEYMNFKFNFDEPKSTAPVAQPSAPIKSKYQIKVLD